MLAPNHIPVKDPEIYFREWAQEELRELICSEESRNIAEESCLSAFHDPSFVECQRKVSPLQYIKYCIDGMCKNAGQKWHCTPLSEYANKCALEGTIFIQNFNIWS